MNLTFESYTLAEALKKYPSLSRLHTGGVLQTSMLLAAKENEPEDFRFKLIPTYIALIDSNPVGILVKTCDGTFSQGVPLAICVDPEYRRKGIGSKLLAYYDQNTSDESIVVVADKADNHHFFNSLLYSQKFSKTFIVANRYMNTTDRKEAGQDFTPPPEPQGVIKTLFSSLLK